MWGYWLVLSPTVIFSWVGILKLRIQSCALFLKEQCWISKACLLLNNYYTWLEYLGKYIPTHAWTLEVSPGKAQLSREDLAWITDNINPHVISWYLARSQRIKLYTLNERRLSDRNYWWVPTSYQKFDYIENFDEKNEKTIQKLLTFYV